MPIGGMNNSANPIGAAGILPVSIQNMEFWPRGSLGRRRGFRLYCASTVPEAASSYALFDPYVYDRYIGSTRCIDLMARTSGKRLLHNRLWTGYVESTGNKWAISAGASSLFTRSTIGGQWFSRNNLTYYSCGSTSLGFTSSSVSFRLGLNAPTGWSGINIASTTTRAEPGYYEYTYTSYNEGRNVESLPNGFVRPSTVQIYASPVEGPNRSYTTNLLSSQLHCIAVSWFVSDTYKLTFDSNASTVNIYRRHLYDVNLRAAGRADDVRLVASAAITGAAVTDRLRDRWNDTELGGVLTYCGSSPKPWIAVAEHAQRWVYVYKDDPWNLWISEVDAPEMVGRDQTVGGIQVSPILLDDAVPPYSGESRIPVRRDAGPIMALASVGSVTVVLCANQIWRLSGSGPGTYALAPINENIGCVAPRSVVRTPYGLLWVSQEGITWWRGEEPDIITKGWLDFDDSTSDVRWNRGKLRFALAAYDPAREQVEFAFPSFSGGGNDRILVLDVGLSSPSKPVFTWYSPQLATGETITGMTTIHPPTKAPFVLYTTSKGRTLFRSGSEDDNSSTGASNKFVPSLTTTPWKVDAWLGGKTSRLMHTNAGVRLTQDCAHNSVVACSLWSRETARVPPSGLPQTVGSTISCSSLRYGAGELGVQGNFLYMRLRETASSAFALQDLFIGSDNEDDWRTEG